MANPQLSRTLAEYPVIARNLTFKAGRRKIIDNISLVLRRNEYVGLIGGSGSGKTTLMTCLNGYREPDEGSVYLNGIDVEKKEQVRPLIGYVPQDDIVHAALTVESALSYALRLRSPRDLSEDKITYTVGKVMYQLDLREHRDKRIRSLSGGQRKRVSIGVELLHSPPLFFLDEPTAGLDPALERQMMRLLAKLADENRLIMVTTHLMQHVTLFDVLVFIHKGRMIYCGPSRDIMAYFRVGDMVDLFEKVLPIDPGRLSRAYQNSSVYRNFLAPRLKACAHVQ